MDDQLQNRIEILAKVGIELSSLSEERLQELKTKARVHNPWFTEGNVTFALEQIGTSLQKDALAEWMKAYDDVGGSNENVGLILAGNIPFVGFHDLLCCLISGNPVQMKLSHQDRILPEFFLSLLQKVDKKLSDSVQIVERLKGFELVIATGSDNSARYFEHYFGKYPHIIRKNRSSLAILSGDESKKQESQLADDIFRYFGRGCRNVSALLIPESYDVEKLNFLQNHHAEIRNHSKYANNYDYQKALFLMNQVPFSDGGHFLLCESDQLHSPMSVIHFRRYKDHGSLNAYLKAERSEIQCIVSASSKILAAIQPGTSQSPKLNDYADMVDTIKFLREN